MPRTAHADAEFLFLLLRNNFHRERARFGLGTDESKAFHQPTERGVQRGRGRDGSALSGTIRQTTDVEHQVDGIAVTLTRAYLAQAESAAAAR